jgi:hypothetical protein
MNAPDLPNLLKGILRPPPRFVKEQFHRAWELAEGEQADIIRGILIRLDMDVESDVEALPKLCQLLQSQPMKKPEGAFVPSPNCHRWPPIRHPRDVECFFAHHPILRAICGGCRLTRTPPKDPFMPNVMRWTIYDGSSLLVRVLRAQASCSPDSNGWDDVCKTTENRPDPARVGY